MNPKLLIFPGASLMNIEQRDDRLEVSCPGCAARVTIQPADIGTVRLDHGDGCKVNVRIQEAIKHYERGVRKG